MEDDMRKLELMTAEPLEFRHDMRRSVTLALQRGNADMLAHAVIATCRHVGPDGQVSCTIPSAAAQLGRAGYRVSHPAQRNALLCGMLGVPAYNDL